MDKGSDPLRLVKSVKLKSSRIHAPRFAKVLWQKGFYEHVLRADESIKDVAGYIWLNPVRNGMMENPESYPFSGSFTGLQMPAEWSKPGWRPL